MRRARNIAQRFKPSAWCERPRISMGVAALVAETEEEAHRLSASRNLWVVRLLTGRPIPFPPPDEALDYPYTEQEAGDAEHRWRNAPSSARKEQVRTRLLALADAHGAEELVVVTITYDYASRLKSYELLAQAFALKGAATR